MLPIEHFFTHLSHFSHREIFRDGDWIFEPLKRLAETLESLIANASQGAERAGADAGFTGVTAADPAGRRGGAGIFINRWFVTEKPLYFPDQGILIGQGVFVEPSAVIKGPALIGEGCEIRQGAYLRGNVLVGAGCIIGHATEIKNSILMDHSECGHFNYIGDSILGSHVNMGAGSRLANFQFRTPQEKQDNIIREIALPVEGRTVPSGMQKLGAVVGDNVELGCNAVISPGTLIGRDNWIYPNTTLPKGYYPPDTLIGPKERKPKISAK